MDLLIITAASVRGTTNTGVEITVKVNGQPVALENGGVQLPPAPRPLPVEVTLTPNVKHLFGATGKFAYLGNGQLIPADEGAKPPHFRPVRAVSIEGGSAVMSLIGYVSRLRDVTTRTFKLYRTLPDRRPAEPEMTKTGNLGPVSHVRTLSDPPLLGANLSFDKAETIDPDADLSIFEVAVEPAPKLVAVACPRNLLPTGGEEGVQPLPVLLCFHSTMGQNVQAGFYKGDYPFSWDFLQFGLYKYLLHVPEFEPLRNWGGKGMPYQMRRSGKQAIYVLPLNKPFAEVGVMIDAAATQDILEEVTALLLRQRGLFIEPGLGRVGLVAFSSGNLLVTQFLKKNAGSPFLNDVLKEVYNLDIPSSGMAEYASAAKGWLDGGKNSDKMLRLYTQQSHPQEFASLLGTTVPAPPFVVENAQKLRTAICLPPPTWFPLAKQQMASPSDFGTVHQLIAETCLVDAMRRSGFPAIPK